MVLVIGIRRLRCSALKAARELERRYYEKIFLPLPKRSEVPLIGYVLGYLKIDTLLKSMRGESHINPYKIWMWHLEPIIEVIRNEAKRREFELHCYLPDVFEENRIKATERLLPLIIKARVYKKIDIKSWIEIIKHIIEIEVMSNSELVREIIKKLTDESIIIYHGEGINLTKTLKNLGFKIIQKSVGPPYRTPLEELIDAVKQSVEREKLEELIHLSVKYLMDYVATSDNVDEAYKRWVKYYFKKDVKC